MSITKLEPAYFADLDFPDRSHSIKEVRIQCSMFYDGEPLSHLVLVWMSCTTRRLGDLHSCPALTLYFSQFPHSHQVLDPSPQNLLTLMIQDLSCFQRPACCFWPIRKKKNIPLQFPLCAPYCLISSTTKV